MTTVASDVMPAAAKGAARAQERAWQLGFRSLEVELEALPTWVKSPGLSMLDGVEFSASLSVWMLMTVPAGIGPLPSRSAVVLATTSNATSRSSV